MENHLCPSSPSPFHRQNPENWQQAFWNSLKSAFQNTWPVWGLGFLEAEGRAVRFDCTVCSSAMTQLLYNLRLCTHDLQTQQNSCSAPKLSAGAAYLNAAGQSLLLPSYIAKAVELEQSYTLPGPPPRRTQNRSRLKKKFSAHRSLHTGTSTLRTSKVLCSWATEAPVLICHQILPGLITVFLSINSGPVWERIFAGSPSVTRTSKWVLCMH